MKYQIKICDVIIVLGKQGFVENYLFENRLEPSSQFSARRCTYKVKK